MKLWLAFAFVTLTLAGTAAASPTHYGHPGTWFNRHAPAQDKLRILQSRVKHASDVERFFDNHPRLAHSRRGRDVRWQHKRMCSWALRRVLEVRREIWLELPDARDWGVAVRIAQRPYPGTAGFLRATSADEGGWSQWKPYRAYGASYYAGYENTDEVGGWMQYRPSTFSGHYRHALHNLKERGFSVPERLRDAQSVRAWRSPLAQALAAGWACWAHQTYSHWSSSRNGC